jgi:hypothetical protein
VDPHALGTAQLTEREFMRLAEIAVDRHRQLNLPALGVAVYEQLDWQEPVSIRAYLPNSQDLKLLPVRIAPGEQAID